MNKKNFEDPIEERWCESQRTTVAEYLDAQGVQHGHIGEWPAWHVAPYVSIWAVESLARPDWIGWWVICGDLPTDYISSGDIAPPQHPRKAVYAIAERWRQHALALSENRESEDFHITGPHSQKDIAPLLATRANLLIKFTEDDSLWEDE